MSTSLVFTQRELVTSIIGHLYQTAFDVFMDVSLLKIVIDWCSSASGSLLSQRYFFIIPVLGKLSQHYSRKKTSRKVNIYSLKMKWQLKSGEIAQWLEALLLAEEWASVTADTQQHSRSQSTVTLVPGDLTPSSVSKHCMYMILSYTSRKAMHTLKNTWKGNEMILTWEMITVSWWMRAGVLVNQCLHFFTLRVIIAFQKQNTPIFLWSLS